VAQVLALAARLALHDADAVRLTAAAAAEEQAAGRPLTATSLYVSALLAGSTEAADPLAVAAAQVHDWSGELGRRLAAGVRDRAADDLVDLATQAEGRGCLEIALLVAGTAARVARGGDDAEVLRRAQSLEARLAARSSRGSTRGARGAALHRLTPREQEIARLILHGAGNQTVAQTLHLSVRTVEGHLSRIYTKLAIGGREELAALLG
jgi:DNA-binding CsgD family transcriptional regulator